MEKITKKVARSFAQEFFHSKKYIETWTEDNVVYLSGIVQLEIFPLYGEGSGQPYPYGSVMIHCYRIGTVQYVDGKVLFKIHAKEATDLMHCLAKTLLSAVDDKRINERNGESCIESNILLFKAVELARKAERF